MLLLGATTTVMATDDALSGKFTVNEQGKQVQFAKGNLQYVPSTGMWQFAASQTEIVGVDAAAANEIANYTGAIDLFAWGTDYGSHIGKGWRMLTNEEWEYLLREEEIGDGPMNAGQATINGTQHGLMLVPDGWTEFGELTFSASPNNWTTNNYSIANMTALEESGVVFLPCVGDAGTYWSATPKDESKAYGMYFSETTIAAGYSAERSNSYAVRLVKDVGETPSGIENGQWAMDNGQWTRAQEKRSFCKGHRSSESWRVCRADPWRG